MSSIQTQAIGIFDSGIGGLTVARAILEVLPNENMIYFGDTANLPYGDKSPEKIQELSQKIVKFLLEKKCKAIVIACNTASAAAFEILKKKLPKDFPLINVIDPVVDFVAQEHLTNVGIIGTQGTIRSKVYQNKLAQKNKKLAVQALATPLLAKMIEEGFFNDKISQAVLEKYLADERFKNIDSMILACTHYPLIEKEIDDFFKQKIKIINSAKIVAQYTKEMLTQKKLLNLGKASYHFYVSDYTECFKKSAQYFFPASIQLEKMVLK